MKKISVILAGALLLIAGTPRGARAAFGETADRGLYLGAGGIAYNMSRFGQSATGETSTLGDVYPAFSLGMPLDLSIFRVSPMAAYTLFGKTNADATKTRVLAVTLPMAIGASPTVDIKAGPGVIWFTSSGPGGSVTMPNGTSTSNYYLPSDSRSSRLYVLTAGLALKSERYRVDLDGLVSDPFTSRRAVNLALLFSYAIFQ